MSNLYTRSQAKPQSPKYTPGYRNGDNKACCDRCGRQRRASQLKREWTNLLVCETCFETKHPQDYLKAHVDNPTPIIIRPRQGVPTELESPPFDPYTQNII